MEIMNNYNSYVAPNVVDSGTRKKETEKATNKATNKAASASDANKSNNEEYLKKLQKQVPDMKLKVGTGFGKPMGKITHCITIHPKLLEKMQNDPQAAKEYTQRLKDIQRASNYVTSYYKAKGDIVYDNDQWYIDENGKHSHFAQIIIKDRMNERMRKEAEENAKEHIEKLREKTKESVEQLAEKLKKKAEQLLDEKAAASKDGMIYLYDTDIKTIIETIEEEAEDKAASRQQAAVGANLDLHV